MKATVATQYDTDSPSHRGDAQEEGEEEPVRQLSWPAGQRGREITVYIFKYCHQYGNGPMDNLGDPGTNHIYHLSPEFEAGYDSAFWFDFIRRAERALATAGVRSRGTADGDLALPTCRYASLRNEAFCMAPSYSHPVSDCNSASYLNRPTDTHVELEDLSVPVPVSVSVPDQHRQEMQYPPNNKGWNAAGHFNPLSRVISCLQTLSEELTYRGVMS